MRSSAGWVRRPRARRGSPTGGRARRGARGCARPGTLRWISDFGSRSATIDGASSPASRSAIVNVCGPAASSATQLATRPSSLQVPSTSNPPGWRRAHMVRHASGTSPSSYCRRTLRARMTAARRPSGSGTSNPPSRKLTPGRAAADAIRTRSGSISMPMTSTSGRTRAQPLVQLEARRRGGAVAEVDDERVVGAPQHGERGDPAIDAAQPVGAGGAARDPPSRCAGPAHAPILTWLG